ncbi:MAG: hypothetical protein MUE85_11135 [Microscillaceae bacterium]|jgi:hypothetical protein|nr:hypothetical protein [Microscillaceae bacterium]
MKSYYGFLPIDLTVQAFMLGLNSLLIIAGFFSSSFWFFTLYLMFFVGVYQFLLSAPVHLLSKPFATDITQYRHLHFFGSLGFLFSLWLGAISQYDFGWFGYIYLFIFPQIIAYAYLMLTWQDYRARKNYFDSRPTKFAF